MWISEVLAIQRVGIDLAPTPATIHIHGVSCTTPKWGPVGIEVLRSKNSGWLVVLPPFGVDVLYRLIHPDWCAAEDGDLSFCTDPGCSVNVSNYERLLRSLCDENRQQIDVFGVLAEAFCFDCPVGLRELTEPMCDHCP